VGHVVGEYILKGGYADSAIRGEIGVNDAKNQIEAISKAVAGATVLLTQEGVSDEELGRATSMATSVVENNSLKDFDAYVAFGKSIFTGAGEQVWEDVKNLAGSLASPKETYNALKELVSSPDAMAQLGKDTYKEVKDKLNYIGEVLLSDTEYGNKEATLAGEKTGEILLLIGESVGSVGGLVAGVKSVGNIAKNTVKRVDGKIDGILDIKLLRPTDINPVEFSNVGSKGNWDKLINKDLKPNTAYQLDNGHTYITDSSGRISNVEADLTGITADRNGYQQSEVGKNGRPNDQGGHLIASTLGGAGDRINLVSMDKVLNNGAYKAMESNLKNAIDAGKEVSVEIDVSYPVSGGTRPNGFVVTTKIDGSTQTIPFRQ